MFVYGCSLVFGHWMSMCLNDLNCNWNSEVEKPLCIIFLQVLADIFPVFTILFGSCTITAWTYYLLRFNFDMVKTIWCRKFNYLSDDFTIFYVINRWQTCVISFFLLNFCILKEIKSCLFWEAVTTFFTWFLYFKEIKSYLFWEAAQVDKGSKHI